MKAVSACPGSARVSRAGDRVLAIANFPSISRLFAASGSQRKDCFGATPKVRAGLALARGTRALPGTVRCALVVALLIFATSTSLLAQADPASEPAVLAVAKILPAVVNINTERVVRRTVRDPFEDFYAQFFGYNRVRPREIRQTL